MRKLGAIEESLQSHNDRALLPYVVFFLFCFIFRSDPLEVAGALYCIEYNFESL